MTVVYMSVSASATTPLRRRLLSDRGLIRLYVFCVAFAAALVWSAILEPGTSPSVSEVLPKLLVVAALAYATEAWVVHVHYRRAAHSLSLNEIVVILGLFYLPPSALLLAQLIGTSLAFVVNRRQRGVKLVFNVVQLLLTTGIAVAIFQLLLGSAPLDSYRAWGAAMAAVSFHAVAGVVLVAIVIAIAEREWSGRDIFRTAVLSIMGTVAAGSLALVAVELIRDRPATMVLLVVPTMLCGLAFSSYIRQRQESERVHFLYESMRKTQAAADPALAVRELLLSARHLLRADYAEVLLLSGDERIAKRFVCGSDGSVRIRQAGLDDIERSTLSTVLATRQAVLLPRHRRATCSIRSSASARSPMRSWRRCAASSGRSGS
jgi:hypothetical protein